MPGLRKIGLNLLWQSRALRRATLSALIAALILGSASTYASKKMRPLTRAEVAGAWVGISEDELYIFRISLAGDGKGSGAYCG
jgi:hypothetical protein